MSFNNSYLLGKALTITEAAAKGGSANLAGVLRTVYEELKKINEEDLKNEQ